MGGMLKTGIFTFQQISKKAPEQRAAILSAASKRMVIPMILRPVWRKPVISPLLLNSSVSAKVCGVR